jgi:hypothetical protein
MMAYHQQERPDMPADRAVDQWIARGLKRAHDRTLSEPLPDDLARLLEAFPTGGQSNRN